MISRALAAALLVGASACALERPQAEAMPMTTCDVSVHFGSFAMGIDVKAAAAVEHLIDSDPGIAGVTRSARGIEGEYTLCIQAGSDGDSMRLFENLRQSLGEGVRAPVTLKGPRDVYLAPFLKS